MSSVGGFCRIFAYELGNVNEMAFEFIMCIRQFLHNVSLELVEVTCCPMFVSGKEAANSARRVHQLLAFAGGLRGGV